MEKEVYLANPCKASSLPFWKTNLIKIVASGIAELDVEIKEGILEWIQVSPEYRGKGLGKFVVNELLWRMKDKVEFVTVSGKVDDFTNPRGLYIACGFTDEVIWHVMRKVLK